MPAKPLMLPRRLLAAAPTGARAFGRRTGAKAHLPPAPKRRQQPAPRRRDPPQAVARVVASAPAPPAPPPSPLDETLAALAGPPRGGATSSPGARRAYRAAAYEAARKAWDAAPAARRTAAGWTLIVRLAAAAGAPDAAAGLVDEWAARDAAGFAAAGQGALAEVVLGFARAGRAADAVATFDAARALGALEPAPPRRAFDGYLEALALQRLPERALQVLGDMREAGVRPAAATYAALLRAAATAPQWHPAYGFLTDEILDAMEGDGVAPSAELFDALVRCAGACGDHVAAAAYFQAARRFGCAPSPARYAAYLGALARAATVGVRGGTRGRHVPAAPFAGLGVDAAEAAAPAADVSVTTGEDAGGRGFRRKGEAGPATPVAVDDDDAGDDADVRAALAAALAEAGLDAGPPRPAAGAGDDDVEAFLETLFEAATEEDLDALMQALPDDDEEATAVATVGNGVPRLREMALEGAPRNSVELRDRQAAVLGLAEAAWAALLDDGLAPDAACLNAYYSVYSRALRRKRAAAIYDTFAERFPDRFPDARTARHAVELRCRLGDLEGARALCAASDDPEALGAALDAHARKGDLDRSRELCARLVRAYAAYAATGRGASDRAPAVPRAVAEGAFDAPRRPRGPPERFLRNFRRLCRSRGVAQPAGIGVDPVLWRRRGNDLRRSKAGKGDAARHRSYARV